tara:strand:- start:7009 stop:9057 length:2049 start_codon:yes stop_codon:yes gene_type:complete
MDMKHYLSKTIWALFIIVGLAACDDDEQLTDVSAGAPSEVSADFSILQDNSGTVSIFPSGKNANSFQVDFGDGSELSEEFVTGKGVTHVYPEGTYNVTVFAKSITGEVTEMAQELVVSFRAPENLVATITTDDSNPFLVSVSAEAEYAASFTVDWGEDAAAAPTALMPGETVTHEYGNVGVYTITVEALSGGTATTTYTQEVEIVDPLVLPITFESPTVDYSIYAFGGGGDAIVVDNPAPNDVNDSPKVASYTKPSGSETWAGLARVLSEDIDFSRSDFIAVDVYSPAAGTPVLFKIENRDNADINAEFQATTTVANAWETLVFDLSGRDAAQTYGTIVMFFNFNISGTGETYYFDNIRNIVVENTELPLGFESENLSYNWGGFGGATGQVVDNPDASSINTSAKVTQLDKGNGAQTWAGISLNLDTPLDFSNGTTARMKVWSPEANVPILLKFEDSQSPPDGNGNPSVIIEVITNTTVANAWEELSFDLTSFGAFDENNTYDRVIVFYDFNSPGAGTTFYFDDIVLGDSAIVSLFSENNTDVNVDTWRTDWSAADYEEITFEGATVKHYYNLNYVGIETTNPTVDASAMTHFHTDVYVNNATAFRIKLVDFGANGVYDGGGDDVEHELEFTNLTAGAWNSLDIPLSDFAGLTTRGHIAQLIYSGNPSGAVDVYLKNIYFHN